MVPVDTRKPSLQVNKLGHIVVTPKKAVVGVCVFKN